MKCDWCDQAIQQGATPEEINYRPEYAVLSTQQEYYPRVEVLCADCLEAVDVARSEAWARARMRKRKDHE